jgi:hypothetical protein
MSVGLNDRLRRLERLEPGESRRPRSPEHLYVRMRQEARESIEESLAEGSEPLYEIATNGDILTWEGRTVNHRGDFIGALDRRIRALDDHIAKLEREEAVIEDGRRDHGP